MMIGKNMRMMMRSKIEGTEKGRMNWGWMRRELGMEEWGRERKEGHLASPFIRPQPPPRAERKNDDEWKRPSPPHPSSPIETQTAPRGGRGRRADGRDE